MKLRISESFTALKARELPMKDFHLFKDFEERDEKLYRDLTDEQKEYTIVSVIKKKGTKTFVIASDEIMKLFNLKPYKFGRK